MPSKITICVLVTVGLVASGCYEQPGCSDCATDGEDADVAEWQDTDGDTIRDGDEGRAGERDTDSDGTPDYLDLDADGDGVEDADEAGDEDLMTPPVDSDADGTPDFMDPDSDSNGIGDGLEPDEDMDGDGLIARVDLDDDGDGCIDPREGSADGDDTDGDGAPDYQDIDADGDGIPDADEGCSDDCDGDTIPNRVDEDSDGTGLPDIDEGDVNTDEESTTGADDVPDYCDPDNDGDGLKDSDEIDVYLTDPLVWDTDGDGDFDYLEVVVGTDPTDGDSSLPDDALVVGPDESGADYVVTTSLPRVDLVLLAGTGGDIAPEIGDLSAELPAALPALAADVELSIVAFEDFGDQGYGPADGVPAQVMLHSTADPAEIAGGFSALESRASLMAGTVDPMASGVEAVYQTLTGEGLGTDIIPAAGCATSPLEPERFGLSCARRDAYTILAILSDRLVWNAPGCLATDPSCAYVEDDFPPGQAPHGYPDTGGLAYDLGVRVLGLVPEPGVTLDDDPTAWLDRLASDTDTILGGGASPVVDLGSDASTTTEELTARVAALVESSPFDAEAIVVDLPDSPPQDDVVVSAFGLAAYPLSCDPPSGPWGSCTTGGDTILGVGPDVDVLVHLTFSVPDVYPRVAVLAFEVAFTVEERMVIDRRTGWLVVPEVYDPSL